MKRKIKKIMKIILLVLLAAVISLGGIFMVGSDSNEDYIAANFESVGGGGNFYIDENTGYYTFIKDDIEDFKILQLTDSHIGGGIFSIKEDKAVLDAIYTLVKASKPDLIIFTGDITYPFFPQSGNINNLKTQKQFACLMEKMQIPWTVTLGNHDTEIYSIGDREEVADFYASDELEYCIFTKNPEGENLTGFGNQIINIRDSDNTLNTSLVLFDSNAYINGNMFKYDIIRRDQVEWYRDAILSLSTEENGIAEGEVVSSLAFFHIPLNEYQTAWDLYLEGSDEVTYLYGVKEEDILCPTKGDGLPVGTLFDEMVDLGSTKAAFCGHNHKNNFAVVYKGIQLTFGNSLTYLGLFGIGETDKYRGGTLISVGQGGTFSATPIFLKDVG